MLFANTPIRRKLMGMILVTSGVVLLLTCASFLGYEYATFRQNSALQLSTLAKIIAAESTAAIAFDNQTDATEVLEALRAERNIVAACIYDRRGKLFSRYPAAAPEKSFPAEPQADGYRFTGARLISFTPIVQRVGSERLGTLFISSGMDEMNRRLKLYGTIALFVSGGALIVAYFLSRALQRQISRPVLALAETARAVSHQRDYSVRARKLGSDELGLLTDTFNDMLAQIETQNQDLERRVSERTAELEAANDELEAFGSSAAHDLRTPLRAISGFAEILLGPHAGGIPPEKKRYVQLIQEGAQQMSQLINDLLSFSRLGRQSMAKSHVSLEQIVREVYAQLEEERRGRNVELKVHPLPDAFGDPGLLRVVIMNLLANALKYSRPRNPAVIEVGAQVSAQGKGTVYSVKDNGVGFDLRDADKLFGVFQRLHHAHEFEGTGVGLATVRRIVERHGGRIWADAQPDLGATFYFTLPLPATSPGVTAPLGEPEIALDN